MTVLTDWSFSRIKREYQSHYAAHMKLVEDYATKKVTAKQLQSSAEYLRELVAAAKVVKEYEKHGFR